MPPFLPQRARPGRALALTALSLALLSSAVLVACQPAVGPAQAQSDAAAAPPSVPVVAVVEQTLEPTLTQIGRVEASERVEVRPRVAGPIKAVLFREGDVVAAGQPLFQIDARPYDAAALRATAEVQLARVRESLTRDEAERARTLAAEHAIAAEEAERRQAAHAEAQARLAAAEAALQTAQLDREFTVVRAPIAGRIGRALVTAGNMVGTGTTQAPLATLVATTPLHVHFDVAERAVVDQLAALRARGGWQAQILDAEGQRVLARAPIDFADNEIVAGTGTLRLRARVDAPPAQLVPGGYARVQLVTGKAQPTLLVPDKAIGTDQASRFVLVVGADGKVAYRTVRVGAQRGELRVVESGVEAGEQVIVAGLMRVRPGMTVQAQPQAAVAERAAPPAAPRKG